MSNDSTLNMAWVPDWTLPDWSVRTYTSGDRLVLEAEQDAPMGDILRQVYGAGWQEMGDPMGELVSTDGRPTFVRFYMVRR
ncbi:hypothetical protein [Microlunatus antarcticus]|uniref:Uncharacterized protein n=1 Tax=Microlunatus antarcticus TaxID=53388 RepID=A0A7W5JSF0_9ACTN|nr:hypothetical protein [Microlunatus antarcticus]MBB3325479.1 hypothetical protein [Microlunatus antarcticus]